MSYSFQTRKNNIEQMQKQEFDLVVIGGGISGAGVARDAASRGMTVALVEAQDYASGTSSRSSKLIHGGIRYLENLEFGLVFEALTERRNLFEMAPHLVHPLRFVLPVYKGARVGMFKMGLGMWLYDALSMFEAPQMHERLNNDETMQRIPVLNAQNLCGSYVYSDAYMDDDRLVVETLRSAVRMGSISANYVRATGIEMSHEKVTQLICRNEMDGQEFMIKGRHFVSTVGPWTDLLGSNLLSGWKRRLRPSKGVHLTFRRNRLPLDQAVVMVSDDQKRIVFAIPRHEMIIIGTTDTDYPGDPADVKTDRSDVDYLMHIASSYFPGANLKEDDIVASYSGVRPLVDDGSDSESKTSREHLIFSDPRGVTFVTGGKYTTYRKMAQDTVIEVLRSFSEEKQIQFAKNRTLEPLNPLATSEHFLRAFTQRERWAREFQINVGIVNMLIERHGEEAYEILRRYSEKSRGQAPVLWRLEALHAIHETMCLHLVDFYLRRSPLFLSQQDHGFLFLQDLATLFQNELGWSSAERTNQINAVRQHLQNEMGWRA